MDSRTQQVINAFEDDEELYGSALAEVIGLMAHEYEVENRLENAAAEFGVLGSGGRVDWSQVIGHFRERAAAEFIRNELRRNQWSEDGANDLYMEQGAFVLDSLLKPSK